MRQIILLSGGMDSMIARRVFYPHAIPVFVRTGSRYQHLDLSAAKRVSQKVKVLSMPTLRENPDGVVPHRNALLLAYVANHMRAEAIVVSSPRGELIWDQQPAFHRAMERVLGDVEIVSPLRDMTKAQAVGLLCDAFGRNRAERYLAETRSCYSATEQQCGECSACVKRYIALRYNGFHEEYTVHPHEHARQLLSLATWRGAFKYGFRPAFEAWKVFRDLA